MIMMVRQDIDFKTCSIAVRFALKSGEYVEDVGAYKDRGRKYSYQSLPKQILIT